MTLWNVATLALIVGAPGGVARNKVLADLFATVRVRAHCGVAGYCTQSSSPLGGTADPDANG
ncbi:MAG TPA: hypothetical protein VGM37_07130 [Armatimonadota bacterium]|jgi:hypothetical protein